MKTILTTIAVLALLGFSVRAQENQDSTKNPSADPAASNPAASPLTLADNNAQPAASPAGATPAGAEAATTSPALERAGYADGRFEAGLVLGEPTGASLKYWLDRRLAIDGAIGWSFYRGSDFHIHADLLWHRYDVFHVSEGELPLYFGVGARVKFRDNADDLVGIRVPIGVSYLFQDVPVDVFLEVAPIIDVAPSLRGSFTVGVGARYRF